MKNIKVAHLSSAHRDGDVRIFHKECSSLAEAGFDVSCVFANAEERIENGVKVETVNYVHKSRMDRARKTVKLVYEKALEIDADIYHIHDPELLRTGLKLLKKGKKVIYDTHEDTPRQMLARTYLNQFLRNILSFAFEKFEDYASKRMTAIITATPYINDRFLKVNKRSVNVNNYPLASEIEAAEVDFNDRLKEVCYIGGIGRERGIEEIVLAAGKSRTPLHIGGTWPSGVKEELSQLDAWQYVTDLGHITREHSLEVKSKCMAGLVIFCAAPNHVNAQPNKMFEYMASGLPVIGSNFPLWRSIIEDNNCGFCVDPEDPSAIAAAITELMNNPEKGLEMSKNGRRLVREKWNWDIEKEKLFALYKEIAAEV